MDQSPWPLRDLRITTPGLELRFPNDDDLMTLAAHAAKEDYDPSVPAFAVKEDTPTLRSRRFLQRAWNAWSGWKPEQWVLDLVAVVDGETVGHQLAWARGFDVLREVETASWVARAHQGRGLGTLMRAAMLGFVFSGLESSYATSSARTDAKASHAVSRKLGYVEDGILRVATNGEAFTLQRYRISREQFEARGFAPVEIHGLEACRDMFGL
ncbi:GNAT family N-acetyltransferase [Tenggerimyces flavus]|uniref:GNAT family N-acetyltransferase n=1 Tax=Tenggerimyces flavus TaxID=1708749 RepID=A0ABV7YI54_9ACTN|nr:GNAT family protein [Tenggerimyces flavus]MBM7784072.1 RimJ/RimL family protein N-acetyltransferase [Tenggerimyces flavus]